MASNGTSTSPGGAPSHILENVATFSRSAGPAVVSHYSTRPAIDLYGSVDQTDLGSVGSAAQKIVDEASKHLPRDSDITVRGQVKTMNESYRGLIGGLLFAIGLVYLLIVVNFHTWIDPLIVIAALPAALAGVVWKLFVTHTPLSVLALMGAIVLHGRGNRQLDPGYQLCARATGAP